MVLSFLTTTTALKSMYMQQIEHLSKLKVDKHFLFALPEHIIICAAFPPVVIWSDVLGGVQSGKSPISHY